jgi:hypothetical protein
MGEPERNAINQRLERLEKQNRHLKTLGVILILVVMAVTLTRASDPRTSGRSLGSVSDEVKAHKFVLVDPKGQERAILFAGAQGPQLVMSSASGKELLRLAGFDAIGPSLLFYDSHRKLRVRLATDPNGPHLDMLDAREKPVVSLFSLKNVSSLTLWSRKQGNTAVLQTFDEGSYLELEDQNKFKSTLGTTGVESMGTGEREETSAASLVMVDKDGKLIWRAP